jgi:hypothetical protein
LRFADPVVFADLKLPQIFKFFFFSISILFLFLRWKPQKFADLRLRIEPQNLRIYDLQTLRNPRNPLRAAFGNNKADLAEFHSGKNRWHFLIDTTTSTYSRKELNQEKPKTTGIFIFSYLKHNGEAKTLV